MPRLPVISGSQAVKVFQRAGWHVDRQRGSHIMLFRSDPPTTLSVPDHRELDRGTLRAILRQAGISPSRLMELL